MIARLVFTGFRRERARLAVAILGVAAATGLMVWSLGLTVTAMRQGERRARRMTRPFTCWVTTGGPEFPRGRRAPGGAPPTGRGAAPAALDPALVAAVAGLPGVESALACRVVRATLDYRPGGRVMQGPPLVANITQARAEGCPYEAVRLTGTWPDPGDPEPVAAVCSALFAPRRLAPPPVGSPLVLVTPAGTLTVRIAAIIDLPATAPGFPTLFASAGAMRLLAGAGADAAPPNLLLCQTRGAGAIAAIRAAVTRFAAGEPGAAGTVGDRAAIAKQLAGDALMNFKRQAPLLLTLAVLTALCMLVNALTIGIEQRLRVLALLRTAGMTAGQVARLVAFEGLLVAATGWAVGMAGGWLVLARFVRRASETFPEGVALGWVTPAATAAGVALVAALSLFWPCRRALRIRPLDRLADDRDETRPLNRKRTVAGVILLFPMLILALPLPLSAMARSLLLLFAGLPLHGIGLILVLPAFIRLLERLATPPVAGLLRLDARLLRRRSSRHYPRTAGMMLTLAVGLGSFAAIHIWGGSMMAPFVPSREFPDVIVSLLPNGVAGDAAARVTALEGVADGRCLAIEAAQFNLTDDLLARIAAVEGRPPAFSNVLLFGVEPLAAFGGEQPLADFRFTAGNRREAARALQAGGACLITRMFARSSGLGVGDTLTLQVPRGGRRGAAAPGPAGAPLPAAWRIAGVVDLNWHLVTSRANLRGRRGMPSGTQGPVFVSEADARRMTGNADVTTHLWANLSEAYRALGALPAGQRLEAGIRQTLAVDAANTIRVHHRDEIEDGMIAHGNQLIGDMARAPFWSLIVLATGMVTLLVAAVRASARELAVMRMVGMTRGQLGRLLLGEALVTALGGVLLSLLSGLCIGWTFTGWTRAWMPFGGLPLTLSIPWPTILRGAGFALALCLAVSLPPIIWLVGRKSAEP